MVKSIKLILCAFLFYHFGHSSELPLSKVSVSGQYKSRSEYTQFHADTTHPVFFTGMRVRLGVTAQASKMISLKIEAQDARRFGSEPAEFPQDKASKTIGGGSGFFNLHQGYFKVDKGWVQVTMGRQRLSFGTERFIGSTDWDLDGRAFDGIRYAFPFSNYGRLTLGLFGVGDSAWFLAKDNHTLALIDFASGSVYNHTFQGFAHYYQSGKRADDFLYYYLGGQISGLLKKFKYDLEGAYQGGTTQSNGKSAFTGAFQAGYIWSDSNNAVAGVDVMSGSRTGRDSRKYYGPFGSGHLFYGDLDLFVTNPVLGVIDLFIQSQVNIKKNIQIKCAGHIFRQARGVEWYGYEGDLSVVGRFFPKSILCIGVNVFLPQKGADLLESTGYASDEIIWRGFISPNFWF